MGLSFIIFLLVFLVLFIMGMPIGFSMIISGITYAIQTNFDLAMFSTEAFKATNNFILVAIPMFILTAEVMNATTVADKMYDLANSTVGWIPGGMGHTNVMTSVIFAGMSGSAAADVGGIGYLSFKAMVDRGFGAPFSAAVTAASSCIGPIIPPSIPVIVYCMVVSQSSVARIFLGGVIPGFLMALLLMGYIYITAIKRGYPKEARPTKEHLLRAVKRGFLPVLTPVILLFTISTGVVTISEAAIITVLYAVILGVFVYRNLNLKKFIMCMERTFLSCGAIFIFFVGGKFFSFVLARAKITLLLNNMILGVTDNIYIILLLINVIFIILGFFSETIVNITLFAPVFIPIAIAVGADPNYLGVMIVLNTVIGAITPPVGTLVYNISGLTKVPLEHIFREIVPFIILLVGMITLMIFVPEIVTFLPDLILG